MNNKSKTALALLTLTIYGEMNPSISQAFMDLISIDDAVNEFVDPEGNVVVIETGVFGESAKFTDTANLTTTAERDANGNPLSILLPSGAMIDRNFDGRGNELSQASRTLGGTTEFAYETEFNNVTSVTSAETGILTVQYDSNGNPILLTTPQGLEIKATFQAGGLLSSYTDPLTTISTLSYNGDGLPTRLVSGIGDAQRVASRSYSASGRISSITDAEGRTLNFTHDSMNRVTEVALPDNRNISYGYDSLGNLSELTPPESGTYRFSYNEVGLLSSFQSPEVNGGGTNEMTYTYNLARQLTDFTRADGMQASYLYDSVGRLKTIVQPNGNYIFNYGESTGLFDSIISPDGVTQSQSYLDNLLVGIEWAGAVSGAIGFGYDKMGRMTNLTIANQSYDYEYNLDNYITKSGTQTLNYDSVTGLLNGTTIDSIGENFVYNEFAELIRHTVNSGTNRIYDVMYERDKLGRITSKAEEVSGVSTTYEYAYDMAGKVETVTIDGILVETFTYNSNDSRTNLNTNYDEQDRVTNQADVNFSYNAHGERVSSVDGPNTTQYRYDVQGSLIGVTLPNTQEIVYLLDGQGRRIAKQLDGTTVEAWLYSDLISPAAMLDATNEVVQRYIYARRFHVPDYIETATNRYKVISDHLGSVRLVVDTSDGNIIQRIDYDAWGKIVFNNNPGFQPFAFAGGLYDESTTFIHFGLREYDAQTAQWTSKDPIGFAGSINNLYSYVNNDPINLIDPTGLLPSEAEVRNAFQVGLSESLAGDVAQSTVEAIIKQMFSASNPIGEIDAACTLLGTPIAYTVNQAKGGRYQNHNPFNPAEKPKEYATYLVYSAAANGFENQNKWAFKWGGENYSDYFQGVQREIRTGGVQAVDNSTSPSSIWNDIKAIFD